MRRHRPAGEGGADELAELLARRAWRPRANRSSGPVRCRPPWTRRSPRSCPRSAPRLARQRRVQPAAAKTEATPSRVTSAIPEVGCDETPTMPDDAGRHGHEENAEDTDARRADRPLSRPHPAREDAGDERGHRDHGDDSADHEGARQVALGRGHATPGFGQVGRAPDRASQSARHRRERSRHGGKAPQHGQDAGRRHRRPRRCSGRSATRCRRPPCRPRVFASRGRAEPRARPRSRRSAA